MSDYPRAPVLPRLLFVVTVGCAALLVLGVACSPWLDQEEARPEGWLRLVAVFARDRTVRRIAIASALGLLVTAGVFFRPPRLARRKRKEDNPSRRPPGGGVVGA
jgi:hypothetical protein